MSASRKNFSRPSSSVPDSDPPQAHPSFYGNPHAASSQSQLAPPTVPFATRRKRTSSLPGNAQRMEFSRESEGERRSMSTERPRHLTAPRGASKLSSSTSRDDTMALSSPSSSTSSTASRSPKWYQRWFGTTPAASTHNQDAHDRSSADSTPRTLSKPRTRRSSIHSIHQKYSYSAADAPPLPNNPYWHSKPDGVALVSRKTEAESAGDDYAW